MGFLIDRFCGDVNPMFLCPWCGDILENPKMVELDECEHIFCDTCLLTARDTSEDDNLSYTCPIDNVIFRYENLRSPIKFFMSLYSKFNVFCQFRDNDCQEIVPILEIAEHEQVCKKNPANYIVCDGVCMSKLHKDEVESHRCGDYFMSILNVLTDRLTMAEDQLVILKEEHSEERECLEQQIADLKKENQLLAKRNQQLLNTKKKLPVNSTSASNPASNPSSSPSSSQHSTSRPSIRPSNLLGPNLLDLFKMTVDKYSQLIAADFHLKIAGESWCESSLYQVINRIVTDERVRDLIKYYNLAVYLHPNSYNRIVACQRTVESMHFILSLSALQYLSSHLSQDKCLIVISKEGHCLIPYFAHLSKGVIRFGSNGSAAMYGSRIQFLLDIHKKVKHSFYKSETNLLDLADKYVKNHPPFSKPSIIVSFENLSPQTYTQLLKLGTSEAFVLIMNTHQGFHKAYLNANGDLSTDILANSQQILCDNFV